MDRERGEKMIENVTKTMTSRNLGLLEKIGDEFTKGFKLSTCYHEDWDKITEIFETLNLEIRAHGPILTINERKNVMTAYEIMDMLKGKERVQELVHNGIALDAKELDQYRNGQIFIMILRLFPEYCRQKAQQDFLKWLSSDKAQKHLRQLFNINGTIKTTDADISYIVSQILKE